MLRVFGWSSRRLFSLEIRWQAIHLSTAALIRERESGQNKSSVADQNHLVQVISQLALQKTIINVGSYEDSSSGNGGSEKSLTIGHFFSIFFFLIAAYVVTSAIFLAEKCFPPKKLNLVENFNSDNLDDE